jgi:opacity protein-like surface antigen
MQFWRTMVAALFAAALVMTLGDAAQAQGGTSRKPWRVKIGAYLPADSDTEDALGTNFMSFGVGYDLKTVQTFARTTFEVYADYFKRPKHTIDFGRVEAHSLGVGLATRSVLTEQGGWFTPYAGAGLGIYSSFVGQLDNAGDYDSARRISIGGKFLLGAELTNGIFGEAEFNFVPHPSIFGSDVSLSGFQLRIGYRFGLPWR